MKRWLGTVGLLCVGCGGGGELGKPVAVFPTKAELADMMASRAEPVSSFKTVDVERWELAAVSPAPGAAHPEASVWDRMLVSSVRQTGGGTLSAELRCAAEETARYYVETGGYPDDGTRRYFAERCGSTLGSVRFGSLTLEANASVPDEELVKHSAASVRALVDQANLDSSSLIGLAAARGNGRANVVLYWGRPVATLARFSPLVSGNSITLTGQVSRDAAYALALVNQGAAGVLACEPDRGMSLPRFRVTCPVAADDEQTRIEVATRKPGRVLMEVELGVLVRRSEEAGRIYEPSKLGGGQVATDGRAFQATLLTALNEARREAGRGALALETRQSVVNEKLAPHLWQAQSEGNEELADNIGLGVLAGWDVQGMIRDGGVYWGTVTSSASPGRWLSYALESPLARSILLDPDMSRVAIGAHTQKAGAMALVTTYTFFASKDHRADEDRVFAELVKRRAARKRSAPQRVQRKRALGVALDHVAAGTTTSGSALQAVMEHVSETERQAVSGWVVETNDLAQIPWDESLLTQDPLSVEIGVTHYRAPGGAWGQYAVIFVLRSAALKTAEPAGGAKARIAGKVPPRDL